MKLCSKFIGLKTHFLIFNALKNGGIIRLGKFGEINIAIEVINKFPKGFEWNIIVDATPHKPIVEWLLTSNTPKKKVKPKKDEKVKIEKSNEVKVTESESAWK